MNKYIHASICPECGWINHITTNELVWSGWRCYSCLHTYKYVSEIEEKE